MHATNRHLEVMDFLAEYPAALCQIVPAMRAEYQVDLVLMLHVRVILFKALCAVMAHEALTNAKRGTPAETFRNESPAMLLTTAVVRRSGRSLHACF
jgi:hypothetical protein